MRMSIGWNRTDVIGTDSVLAVLLLGSLNQLANDAEPHYATQP
jgi:hypothetical protein